MKKNIKYFMMAAVALLSMSACNNEMDEQDPANNGKLQPVQFQMSFASTRTTTGDETAGRATTWKAGDAIGIFAYPAGSTTNAVATNFKYILGKDGNWTATGSEIYPDQALDYYAYYPYQDGVTDPAAINVAALTDQSKTDESSYAASDILASKTSNVAAGNGKVTLAFSHMFAMVEVKVQGDLITQKPTKVELLGVKLNAELNLTATPPAATQKADATAQDVTMFCLENPNADSKVYSFRAAVPAQEIAASTPLVRIYAPDAASKTYTMQHTAAVSYNAGQFRQMIVNIGSKRVVLIIPASDTSINPWTPSDAINGDGSEVVPQLITPLSGNLTEIIIGKDAMANATEGWYKALRKTDESNVIFSVTDDASTTWGKVANLTYTSTWDETTKKAIKNSYYIATINYLHKTPLDISKSTIYKLTAKIKSSANELKKNGVLVFMVRCATFDASFLVTANVDNFNEANFNNVNQGTTVSKTPKTADTWEEAVIYVNLNKKSSTNGSIDSADIATKVTDTTADDYAGFDLRIYTNSPATTDIQSVIAAISVSDITIEPYIASAQ